MYLDTSILTDEAIKRLQNIYDGKLNIPNPKKSEQEIINRAANDINILNCPKEAIIWCWSQFWEASFNRS